MAATYLDNVTYYRIIYYDASVPSFTTLATNTTTGSVTIIPTTVDVGDILYIQPSDVWKDFIFNITQAHDGTVTGVWEYNTAQTGGWTTLPKCIDGTAGFTLTGSRRLVFDSPDDHRDWFSGSIAGSVSGVAMIRFRVTAVSGVTVACTITAETSYSGLNAVVVDGYTSGTPATLKNLYDADHAGTRIVAPSLPSTTGMAVAELFTGENGAIRLDFILSGTTAGAGDTIDITGVGADGEDITESIDVSAGDGTYTSAYSYNSVTSFDCTGWTDGEVEVQQGKWGVVKRMQKVQGRITASSARQYHIDRASLHVLSTGYMALTNELLVIERSTNDRRNMLVTAGSFVCTNSNIVIDNRSAGYTSENFVWTSGASTLVNANVFTNSVVKQLKRTTANDVMYLNGPITATDSYIGGPTQVQFGYGSLAAAPVFARSIVDFGRWWTQNQKGSVEVDWGGTSITGGIVQVFSYQAKNLVVDNLSWQSQSGQTIYLTNVTVTDGYPTSLPGSNNRMYRQYEIKITVIDRDGNPLEGVVITAVDQNSTTAFTATTDANGVIATQTLVSQLIQSVDLGALVTYTYEFTLSKDGYQTGAFPLTLDRELDELFVLDEAVPLLLPMGETVYKNLDPTNSQNKVLWEKIS